MNFHALKKAYPALLLYLFLFDPVFCQQSSSCSIHCSYKADIRQANCEKKSLESIPIECNTASYLSLRYNRIIEIEPGIFGGFSFLTSLRLSYNHISHIDANTFKGAPVLESIKLRGNIIHTLNQYALNGTESLRVIYMDLNHLSVIDEMTFQFALKLEVIDLSWNHLFQLGPDVFRHLNNLKRLHLRMNRLTDLPEDVFQDLSSLVFLDLSNNLLSTLHTDIFINLTDVQTIYLSGNRLTAIDGSIFHLPHIATINLKNNSLYRLERISLENWTSSHVTLYLEGNPWPCNSSLEPSLSTCLLWSDFCNVCDDPVCNSPPNPINHPLKSLNQSLCRGINAMTAVPKKEPPENKGKISNLAVIIIIVILVLSAVGLFVICTVYNVNRKPKDQHSHIEQTSLQEPLTDSHRPACEKTPDKRRSQDSPNRPRKNGGRKVENGERNGCRKNLTTTFFEEMELK